MTDEIKKGGTAQFSGKALKSVSGGVGSGSGAPFFSDENADVCNTSSDVYGAGGDERSMPDYMFTSNADQYYSPTGMFVVNSAEGMRRPGNDWYAPRARRRRIDDDSPRTRAQGMKRSREQSLRKDALETPRKKRRS